MYFDFVLGNALKASVEIQVLLWGELAPEKVELRADSDQHADLLEVGFDGVALDPGVAGGRWVKASQHSN